MTAGDGPHYANNVGLSGDGDYRLLYILNRHRKRGSCVTSTRKPASRIGGNRFPRPGHSIFRASRPSNRATGAQSRSAISCDAGRLVPRRAVGGCVSTTVTIHDHRFEPAEIQVPAGKRIVLTVINTDPLSEEFDSDGSKGRKSDRWKISGHCALRSTCSGPLRFHWRVSRGYRERSGDCAIGGDGAAVSGVSACRSEAGEGCEGLGQAQQE